MTTKPSLAILIDRSTQREVLDAATVARIEARFEARWPGVEGKITPEEAARLIRGADGVLTGWGSPNLSAALLDLAPALKVVAHSAGTVKPYVSDALWQRGIVVSSAAAAIAVDVAQMAIGLMLIGRKNLMELAPQTAQGAWKNTQGHRPPDELRGCTVGIIAASHVGREVLSLLRHFDVRVLLYDPFVSAEQVLEFGATKVELDELFRRSDVLSVHAPSIPATKHMVNAARLALLPHGATLINTSRGSLVDEAALVAELQRKRIWAFLDVTDPEPPPPGSPLFGCPNLTLTPHLAGSRGRGRKRLGQYACDELERFFSGGKPRSPVTREMLDKMA